MVSSIFQALQKITLLKVYPTFKSVIRNSNYVLSLSFIFLCNKYIYCEINIYCSNCFTQSSNNIGIIFMIRQYICQYHTCSSYCNCYHEAHDTIFLWQQITIVIFLYFFAINNVDKKTKGEKGTNNNATMLIAIIIIIAIIIQCNRY